MILGILALFALFSLIVMLLWNAVMPDLVGVGSLTYLQAAGILLLGRILFGGQALGLWGSLALKGMHGRFHAMSPEQREAFIRRMHEFVPCHAGHKGFDPSHGCEESHRTRERHGDGNDGSPRNCA
jgi:hypothetical protein